KSQTADFGTRSIRSGRMTWHDCGLKVAKVCSTLTGAGLCGFLASQAEIHPQSPGMGTGRFGSATSTTASSIRRQRVPFSAFLGRDSDTVTRRKLCCLIGCRAAYGSDLLRVE